MIGIIDYDFIAAKRGLPPPSLAAMKMAAHLRMIQKAQVQLLTNLEQSAACEKVYFFSDKALDKLPKEIFFMANIEMYGKYLESLPKLVEHMMPDISIYKDVIQSKMVSNKTNTSKALAFLDSIYYKAYGSEGERIPLPPSPTRKRFYIYDQDFLSYEECWEIFDEIIGRSPTSIYTVHPIQCHTVKQFFTLREDYEKVSRANKIILDYYVPPHHFDVYFGKYKLKFLGEITKNSDVAVYLGKNYSNAAYTEVFYSKNIIYCLNLLFSYWSRNIPIRAEVYHPIDTTNPYEDVYNAIRAWANNDDLTVKLEESFNTKKLVEKKEQLIKQYPAFEGFLNKSKQDLIQTRGIWRIL